MSPRKFSVLHLIWTLLSIGAVLFFIKERYSMVLVYLITGAFVVSSVLTLFSYLIVFNSLQKRPALFISGVMMSLFLKMGLGIASILFVSWSYKEFAIPFAVAYMVSYFLYTGPEVLFLYRAAIQS